MPARWLTGQIVCRIAVGKRGVEVATFDTRTQTVERWQAEQCVAALPLFIAVSVLQTPPPARREAATALRALAGSQHAHQGRLRDRPGVAPSWGNVLHGAGDASRIPNDFSGLGYADAMHQSLAAVPDVTVLTRYRAFDIEATARKNRYDQPWMHWRDTVLA